MKAIFKNLISSFVTKAAVSVVAVFLMGGATLFAQPVVKGKVTDASGQPLIGVTVIVSGTSNGTMTDENGNYNISVKNGDVLEFVCLGMATQTFECDGSVSLLNVSLEEDTTFLEETIVVGYGTQKKSSMTSAVSAIKGDELLKAPSTNVSQLLAGKLTGVSSVQESGEPGLDQASLKIRGSVYGVAYVVDGFPVDNINDIDPADVESISVLKDGASAAVYGLQSAGGVIIVTTKKGEKGKPRISYNASLGASMNANFPDFMNGPQFAYWYNMAQMMDQLANGTISDRSQYKPYFTQENIAAMQNGDPTDGWDNVDYIDRVFGTGFTQKHNVTVQGGNDKTRYFVSAGFLGQNGNIDNYNYKRYNVRANIEADITKSIKFTAGLSSVVSRRNTPRYASGGTDGNSDLGEVGWFSIARQVIGMHPYLPEQYNGYYTGVQANNQSYPYSPLAALYDSGYKKSHGFDATANFSLTWNVPWVKGLFLRASGSYDYGTGYNKNLDTPYKVIWSSRSADTGAWAWNMGTDPSTAEDGIKIGEGQTNYHQLVGQASVGYANKFGKNSIDLLALLEVRDNKSNGLSSYGKNLAFSSLPELGFAIPTNDPIGGWSDASRSAGYVFRARYDYDERYLAEFTGRYDGSYKFAGMAHTRWGFFPSGSVAWRISNEDFMSNATAVDDLKLRASVGLLGNDSVSPYMFLNSYGQWSGKVIYPSPTGNTVNVAYGDSGIANLDLTWEKTLSYNVGFDLNMWESKLGLEVDAFYNWTYDMLTGNGGGYPSSMGGYYPAYINFNEIDSKGIDIMISHRNRFMAGGKPFYYGISGTLTYSKTRWLKYQDDPNTVAWRKVVGTTYGALTGWIADGIYRSEEEIDNSAWCGTRPNVGDIKYVDVNGDGKISWDDRGYFGRSNRPELTFGLNLNFEWNGIDFNAQFTGGALFDVSLTGTYYNGYDDNTIWTQTFKEGGNSPLFLVENAYSIDNPNGTFPRLTLGGTGHGGDNGLASTFWWRDGKYVRLKSTQLGYTFPSKWMNKINIEALRIFVEGQNLFTIDGLPAGIDPESQGVNNGYYPQQRLVMGGITLTF